MNARVNVVYMGDKESKADNVAGTGVIWNGPGDVQAVQAQAWPKLAQHPGVWQLADDGEPGAGLSQASSKEAASKAAKPTKAGA